MYANIHIEKYRLSAYIGTNKSSHKVEHFIYHEFLVKKDIQLTIPKSKTRYKVILIERGKGSAYYRDGLFIRIWNVTNCMQASSIE